MAPLPTAAEVSEFLRYEPDTGKLYWRVQIGKIKAGDEAGNAMNTGYMKIKFRGRQLLSHRVAWLLSTGMWPSGQIDHKNGDRKDNRLSNLRDVSISVNSQNKRSATPGSKSGFLGVSFHSKGVSKPWNARIGHQGKTTSIGYFSTPEEAHEAYLAAKRRIHDGCTI